MRQALYQTQQPGIIITMQNKLYALEHYEFIRINGADSISFLQGQISCNTELLTADNSLTGALCNLKGRVIADFRLVLIDEDILMQCAAGMAEKILSTLNKYAVFSKVDLERINAADNIRPTALGFIGKEVDAALGVLQLDLPAEANQVKQGPTCSVIRLAGSEKRIEIWFHKREAKSAFIAASDMQSSDDLDQWTRAEIEAGIIHVTPSLSEEYTPQLLNYDISGLIDFKKGCYTGQEIVARMFYRGAAKKRLFLATSNHEVDATSRVELANSANQNAAKANGGEVIAFSNAGEPSLLLTILASESTESGQEYRLSDQPSSEVRIQSLPYSA